MLCSIQIYSIYDVVLTSYDVGKPLYQTFFTRYSSCFPFFLSLRISRSLLLISLSLSLSVPRSSFLMLRLTYSSPMFRSTLSLLEKGSFSLIRCIVYAPASCSTNLSFNFNYTKTTRHRYIVRDKNFTSAILPNGLVAFLFA